MNKIELTNKIGTIDDVKQFRLDCLDSKLFTDEKCANLEKVDMEKDDFLIIKSRLDDFLTVWSRHSRNGKKREEKASYGIRIKRELAERIPAIGVMFSNVKETFNNDSSEIRMTVYSLDDVKYVITKILQYTQAHKLSKETKEVTRMEVIAS